MQSGAKRSEPRELTAEALRRRVMKLPYDQALFSRKYTAKQQVSDLSGIGDLLLLGGMYMKIKTYKR